MRTSSAFVAAVDAESDIDVESSVPVVKSRTVSDSLRECGASHVSSSQNIPCRGHFQRLPSYPARIRLHSGNCTRTGARLSGGYAPWASTSHSHTPPRNWPRFVGSCRRCRQYQAGSSGRRSAPGGYRSSSAAARGGPATPSGRGPCSKGQRASSSPSRQRLAGGTMLQQLSAVRVRKLHAHSDVLPRYSRESRIWQPRRASSPLSMPRRKRAPPPPEADAAPTSTGTGYSNNCCSSGNNAAARRARVRTVAAMPAAADRWSAF